MLSGTGRSLRSGVGNAVRSVQMWSDFAAYKLGRSEVIPHILKRKVVYEYARRYGCTTFVETGTYLGDMLAAMYTSFEELHSVELSDYYHARARRRFASSGKIHLHAGNSAEVLPMLLKRARGRCLFWLDAHYSGGITARADCDTPVIAEVEAILTDNRPGHIVLIDDARCFDGTNGYPSVSFIENLALAADKRYAVSAALDIIRLVPTEDRM